VENAADIDSLEKQADVAAFRKKMEGPRIGRCAENAGR
jgi:hypothetical protein